MTSSDITRARDMTVASVGLARPAAQEPADHLGAHTRLAGQFRLGQPQNPAPFIQRPDHAVNGSDA